MGLAVKLISLLIFLNVGFATQLGSAEIVICDEGHNLTQQKEYRDAVQAYSRCLETAEHEPVRRAHIYARRGHALNRLKHFEDALLDLEIAIQISPDIDFAYQERAFAYNGLNKPKAAIEELHRGTPFVPIEKLGKQFLLLALMYDAAGEHITAVEYYSDALTHSPQDPGTVRALIEFLLRFDELETAATLAEYLVKLDPKDRSRLVVRGRLYEAFDRPIDALRDYQEAYRGGVRSKLLIRRLRALGVDQL